MDSSSTKQTIWEFTDRDYAVIIDSLSEMRSRIRDQGMETPNLDSTIEKFTGWADPSGCGFLVFAGEDFERVKKLLSK